MTTMRREFDLPEADREFLDTRGKPWETIVEEKTRWAVVDGFDLPQGYNHQTAAVALRLQPTYPDDQIDMAYFSPHLARVDGKQINALTLLQIDGKSWQQWSRHRAADVWRPGIDNIETHLLYVTAFLEGELKK
jgi:hypothetical protein